MTNNTLAIILSIIIFFLVFNFNKLLALLLFFAIITYFLLPYVFIIVANKKYNKGSRHASLIWYEKAYKLKQSSLKIKLTYAYMLIRLGELSKAEAVLKEFLKVTLNEIDKSAIILNLSLVLWKSDRLQEAIKLLEELYNNNFRSTLLYENLGFYYILEGNLQKALAFNLEAYNYISTDITVLDNLAYNYYCLGSYEEALEFYKKLIPMKPAFSSAYYYYALTLEALGNKKEALEMLERGLQCNFSYLSYVKKEQIEKEIERLNNLQKN